jgi:hypothetical protein
MVAWGEPKLRWEVTEVTGSCAMVGLVSWDQKSLKQKLVITGGELALLKVK